MLPEKIYIDSGLLALLVVGATDKNLIAKHRRLREFDEGDYERLVSLINHVDQRAACKTLSDSGRRKTIQASSRIGARQLRRL